MWSQVDIFAHLPSEEMDVKVLLTIEKLRRVGLLPQQHDVMSEDSMSGMEVTDPSVATPSPVRCPGALVIREPGAIRSPASPVVHGKGKSIRLPS